MKGIPIAIRKREGKKKGYVRRLRSIGIIPGTLYGPDIEPTLIEIDEREIDRILRHHKVTEHFLVNFKLGSHKSMQAFVKEIQHDPITGRIIHIDLEAVSLQKPVVVKLPLEFDGIPEGVKKGGIFTSFLREVNVKGIVSDLADTIKVDVSKLGLGDTIHIKDIKVENAIILHDPDEPVATIAVPRLIEEEIKAAEAKAQQAQASKTTEAGDEETRKKE
ncbi:MAG: 50S ribosomal protein L25 [bacterium]